jgi:hypothetical protein
MSIFIVEEKSVYADHFEPFLNKWIKSRVHKGMTYVCSARCFFAINAFGDSRKNKLMEYGVHVIMDYNLKRWGEVSWKEPTTINLNWPGKQ